MRKIKQLCVVTLILLVCVFFVSCPASPSNIEDSGSSLYQKPLTPQNVKATNGYDGLIRITWDPVEDVDGYIILGSKSSEFDNGLTQFDIVTGADNGLYTLESGSRNVDVNQSYIFSVVSYKIYNKTERVLSDNSEYAEGSFAPSELAFHAIINDYYIYLYWMSPTLYRQYYTGGSEVLYDADFVVSYGLSSSPVAEWTVLDETDNNSGVTPWLSQRIETNRLSQEEEYSFHVTMNINDEEGTQISSLVSEDVTFEILSNMGTSPIDDLKVSTDRIDGIELKWSIPEWTNGATRANSYFTIQRTRSGSNDWETLVDETDGLVHSSLIQEENGELTYLDKDVVAGDKYIYRVKNTATDEKGNQYTHVDSMYIPSDVGSLFELNILSKDGTWTPDAENPNSAAVSITWSWDKNLESGLKWKLFRVEKDIEGNPTETEVDLSGASISDNKLTISFNETLDDDLSFREYSYYLNVYNDNTLFGEYGFIVFPSDSQMSLGNTITIVSGDDLDTVVLQWTSKAVIKDKTYSYGYKKPSGSWEKVPFDISSVEYIEFSRPDKNIGELEIQLFIGDTPVSNSVTKYFITAIQNISASKGTVEDEITVTWDKVNGADGYEIFYSATGSDGSYTTTGIEEYGHLNSSTFDDYSAGYFNVKAYSYDINGNKVYTELGKIADGEETTALGEKVPANYGYIFNSDPMIELSTDDGTYLRDNLVFRITPDISHYSYDIAVGNTHIEFETKDVMDGKTHSIANGSVIYKDNIFEVSTENFIGTLNEDLLLNESVSAVTCNGNSSLSSSDSFRNVRRGLSEIEIIEQENKIISVGLHEANDSFLEHDWWGSWSDVFILGWVANGDQQTYPENGVLANGILVTNSSGNNNRIPARPANNGSIKLDGYTAENYSGKISTGESSVEIDIEDDNGAGFLGSDSLRELKQGSISLLLDDLSTLYKSYSVRYSEVYVNHSQGTYYVSVNGQESQGIEATSVSVRPY